MRVITKGSFTLLEVLVVVFLLSIGAIAVGVKLKDFYREQHYYSEVDQILDHLKMAQDLMLILDQDIFFIFTEDKDHHWSYSLQTIKPLIVRHLSTDSSQQISPPDPELSNKWKRLIEKEVKLTAVQTFSFEGDKDVNLPIEPKESHLISKKLRLRFSLGAMTKGDLILSPVQPSIQPKRIHLSGYPGPMHFYSKQKKEESEKGAEESKSLYPKLE